jgi:hypothetical protein
MVDLNFATKAVVFPTGGLSAAARPASKSLDAAVSTVCGDLQGDWRSCAV